MNKMKQSEKTRLFPLVCIAVLLAAYGVGLGVKKVRFAEVTEHVSADLDPEKPANESEDDAVTASETSDPEHSEGATEEPSEELAEEFAARTRYPEGERTTDGQMRQRFEHISEEERARMEMGIEIAKAHLDQENYEHVQEMWPNLPEQVREEIRDVIERWPNMSEQERDYYRAQGLELFGRGRGQR
jgi:hypothetical protein